MGGTTMMIRHRRLLTGAKNIDIPRDKLTAYHNAYGRTNNDPDRGVLPDLSGNNRDAYLAGFSFNSNSGYVDNGLVFDGVNSHTRGVSGYESQFQPLEAGYYTVVFDILNLNANADRLFFQINGLRLATTENIEEYNWWNLKYQEKIIVPRDVFALTNGKAYTLSGLTIETPFTFVDDMINYMQIGGLGIAGYQTKMIMNSIAVFSNVNLDSETCFAIYKKMRNNTL